VVVSLCTVALVRQHSAIPFNSLLDAIKEHLSHFCVHLTASLETSAAMLEMDASSVCFGGTPSLGGP